MLDIVLQGEQVSLLPERALWWPAQKTLIIADLHWGKSGHFRKHGIAIPNSTQVYDEIRLASLINKYNAERLIIAGDLFHSKHNKEVESFTYWRSAHQSLHIELVTGNHDILPEGKYTDWNMQVHREGLLMVPFFIAHNMPDNPDNFTIHGHIHPAVRIIGKGNQAIKLCCFCEDENRLILPAFGRFTGTYILDTQMHKHIYIIVENSTLKWK